MFMYSLTICSFWNGDYRQISLNQWVRDVQQTQPKDDGNRYEYDRKRNIGTLGCGGLILVVATLYGTSAQADIYAYVDENGVRHISNQPTDSRYKLIMKTPKYQPATPSVPPAGRVSSGSGSIGTSDGRRWQVIRPSKNRQANLSRLHKSGQIEWSAATQKPFGINEKTRKQLSDDIARIAAKHQIDPHLIHAVISAESGFNPRAVSHAGAMGLMQLMPGTAERFGVSNPFDPVANINGGARYLRWLLNKFKNDVRLALAGYNAGENAVIKYGRKIPPYKETQQYVGRVLKFYNHFRNNIRS